MGDGWGDNSDPVVSLTEDDPERRCTFQCEGRDWILQAKDPFGFWYVKNSEGGPTPEVLSGAYTGQWEAERAIKQYMSVNPVSPAKREALEKGTTPPKIKFKSTGTVIFHPKKDATVTDTAIRQDLLTSNPTKEPEDAPTRKSTAKEEAPRQAEEVKTEEENEAVDPAKFIGA